MHRLDFTCTFDLSETMIALLDEIDDAYPAISVYGKYDVIRKILEDLIMSGISIANEIDLHDCDVRGYKREFVLYLTPRGISVESIWDGEKYYLSGGNISFVHEDCNSKLLNHIDSKTIYEFGFDDEESEYDCDDCEYKCDCMEHDCEEDIRFKKDDDDMHGFSVHHTDKNGHSSYSFYSTDMKLVEEFAKMFK